MGRSEKETMTQEGQVKSPNLILAMSSFKFIILTWKQLIFCYMYIDGLIPLFIKCKSIGSVSFSANEYA